MREEIIKPGIIRKIIQKVENDSEQIISEETVDLVLSAFFDTIIETLENGDCIKLKGYMTIYPKLFNSKQVHNVSDNQIISIPARYKPRIKAGSKLENACKKLIAKDGDNSGKSKRYD